MKDKAPAVYGIKFFLYLLLSVVKKKENLFQSEWSNLYPIYSYHIKSILNVSCNASSLLSEGRTEMKKYKFHHKSRLNEVIDETHTYKNVSLVFNSIFNLYVSHACYHFA